MDNAVVIACEMMESEIRAAMAQAGADCPVEWVERELHNAPDLLRRELQHRLDTAGEGRTVLLAFAQCGNAAVGLRATGGRVVIPRFADCIHILRSMEAGRAPDVDMRTLYTCKGYLDGSGGISRDYRRSVERHGEKTARQVCRMMVAQYRRLALMDTGGYDPGPYRRPARELAELLNLEFTTCPATIRVYRKLFSGEWDEEFVVVERGSTILQEQFWHSEGT